MFLDNRLLDIKDFEEEGGNSPVRVGGHIPKSFIAFLAARMLKLHMAYEAPVGKHLYFLFEELLDIPDFGRHEVRMPRRYMLAIVYLARHPKASFRTAGKALGVAPSTISRWMQEDHFRWLLDNLRNNPQLLRGTEEHYQRDLPYEIDDL